jgi:hypothetical protein
VLPDCADWLRWYQRVLAARRAHIVPLLRDIHRAAHTGIMGPNAILASWAAGAGGGSAWPRTCPTKARAFPARPRPRGLARGAGPP